MRPAEAVSLWRFANLDRPRAEAAHAYTGHVSGSAAALRECTRPKERDLQILVVDAGIGMRVEDIADMLTPFRQLDNSLARKSERTGLGLPLAKALAELHGGRVDIESRSGGGTTTAVTIPSTRAVQTGVTPVSAAIA